MTRERLIELIHAAVAAAGFAFHTGEQHLIGGTVRVYPAVWLTPPELRAHTGRREGETTWRVALHMMALPSSAIPSETMWQRLEAVALSVATTLADSPAVCSVQGVKCTPADRSLTTHGDTSVTLTCDVTLWYSR
jgi:hypothetical protein